MDYEGRMLHFLKCMLLESAEPKALPLSLLANITDNFSDNLQIGSGGSAVVYKGCLGNGCTVAVKKLSNTIHMDETKYQQEVDCLMKVRHENIVRFLGYCANTHGEMWDYEGKLVMADVRHRLLCFEYLPQGSLDGYITDASRGLNWRERYQIIKGICKGLCYLHEKRIVHSDLKPANILLDDDMVPKICDFGISRCFSEEQTRAITSKPCGTKGYMAPEFIRGVITLKSDIYSLGVILKEILTGQTASLDDHVLEKWRNRLEISLADTRLEQIRVCAEISVYCVEYDPTKRPDIQSIIKNLAETEGADEHIESCITTLVAQPSSIPLQTPRDSLPNSTCTATTMLEEKSSARRFAITSGAKAPYAPAVSLALMKIDTVLADETAKSMVAKLSVEATDLEVMVQKIRFELEAMTKIPMVYMTNKATVWFAKVRKLAYRVEDVMDKYLYYSFQKKDELLHKSYFIRGSQCSITFGQIADELVKIEDEVRRGEGIKPSNLIIPSLRREKELIVPVQITEMEKELIVPVQITKMAKGPIVPVPEHFKHDDPVGIKDNRRLLTEWLYSDELGTTVITVSGMGGSGKTVLAANVYEREMTNFPAHAWIVVSQTYNMEALFRKLLREIGYVAQHPSVHIDKMDVYDLIVEIRRRLNDRKCLIVLDDVWNQDVYIRMSKEFKNTASRIIITTRKNHVAALAPPTRRLDLKPLSNTHAINLFCRVAFQDNVCPMKLEKCATSIVAKCQGLPLAIVTIGSLLYSRGHTDDSWGQMHYQVRNELSNNDEIRETLNPNYNDLSGDLKSCFLYCCLFPEDYLISCESLKRLWVAEGFVRGSENNAAEEVAERNLMELIDNNLLIVRQKDEEGRVVTCGMHGIMRDLACAVAKREKFESAKNYSSMITIDRYVRRLSSYQWNDNRAMKLEFPYLRTLLSLGTISSSPCMLSSILSGSIYLTVLELQDSEITEVPESIGALFNLRYIGLRRTKVKSLPDSVCKLHNLQTLDIKQTKMQNLPTVICKVQKLQHLFADRCADEKQEGFPCIFEVQTPMDLSDLSEFPCSFGVQPPKDLSNLEYLETFETVQATMDLPGQLKNLRRLRCVWIDNISATYCADLFAALSNMPLLSSLLLSARDANHALCIEALRPVSTKLQKLIIRGQWAPGSLECPIFIVYGRYLKYLALSCCHLVEDPLKMLAPHLPNLTYLRLDNIHSAKTLVLSAGSFLNLKTLVLKHMPSVNQLVIRDGALPCIEALYIVSLAELDKVPQGLESLRSLKRLSMLKLHSDFRIQWNKNRMHQKMQHVLEIHI